MIRARIFLLSVLISLSSVSSKPDSSLPKVHDILSLLPKNKIEDIEQDHLKNDDGFRAAVFYLQSNEWRELVNNVLEKTEYQKFSKMAEKYNIDVTKGIDCLKKHIDSLEVTEKPKAEPNLEPFIKKVQAVLPISGMAQTLSEKFANADARKLHDEISSKQNQKVAEAVHNLPEMVKMREILKDMKFDVEPYIALVYTFLGWIH